LNLETDPKKKIARPIISQLGQGSRLIPRIVDYVQILVNYSDKFENLNSLLANLVDYTMY